jgi:putative transposase
MDLGPADDAEAVAIYRATVIGPLMHRVLSHGQLATELRTLSEQRFRPPGAASTRTYSVPTLERWLYAFRSSGLDGLRPQPRSDQGFAQDLTEKLRTLLLDIRREHPDASVPLILKTLVERAGSRARSPSSRCGGCTRRRGRRGEQVPRRRIGPGGKALVR